MPCITDWLVENHIVSTKLPETLSLEELERNDGDILEYIQKGERVHLIIDVSLVKNFPMNLNAIQESSNRYLNLDSMGWVVVIGNNNPMIKFMSRMISRFTGVRLTQALNQDAAIEHLKQHDPTIT